MISIDVLGGLPFVKAIIVYRGHRISLDRCLVDTGSASTLVDADKIDVAGIVYEPNDRIRQIRGVGGTEFVFTKQLDSVVLDEYLTKDFVVEVGQMNYGFELDAILGMDLLQKIGAVIDLGNLQMDFAVKY